MPPTERLPAGPVTVTYDFAYDGGKPGAGGTGTLSIDGKKVGVRPVERTIPFFYGTETADVGMDLYTAGDGCLREGRQPVHGNDQEGDCCPEVGNEPAPTILQ